MQPYDKIPYNNGKPKKDTNTVSQETQCERFRRVFTCSPIA